MKLIFKFLKEYFDIGSFIYNSITISALVYLISDYLYSGSSFILVFLIMSSAIFISDFMNFYKYEKDMEERRDQSEYNRSFNFLIEILNHPNIKEIYMLYLKNEFQRRTFENKTNEDVVSHILSIENEDNIEQMISDLITCRRYYDFKENK